MLDCMQRQVEVAPMPSITEMDVVIEASSSTVFSFPDYASKKPGEALVPGSWML